MMSAALWTLGFRFLPLLHPNMCPTVCVPCPPLPSAGSPVTPPQFPPPQFPSVLTEERSPCDAVPLSLRLFQTPADDARTPSAPSTLRGGRVKAGGHNAR
ncbi:hypothetical protein DPEC_G00227290 [Dallia pectoralis]|uniref:Uncharacterized protein n=1 Tax=Dallia pectoralis TaxID=75939 RepID=A0ACC2G180_DALPE|nr:hypothetical protein DPEC_G00227290 [Dallia pectoralis]